MNKFLVISALLLTIPIVRAQEQNAEFDHVVRPFLQQFCLDCHGAKDPEARLDLSGFQSVKSVSAAHGIWETVLRRLQVNEMPPQDSNQPSAKERAAIIAWIQNFRRSEAERQAGDPGPVLVRRLSNAEYNYSIRDITGVDIQPTANFPVDPANEAGFDNSGESLTMSPALLEKYLTAARQVTDHLVLTPDGINFAPHPVMTDTDRDKFCVKRIVRFYQTQPTDLTEYFLAAWQHHLAQDQPVDVIAKRSKISSRYLQTVCDLLDQNNGAGPLATLQDMFAKLPDNLTETSVARRGCRDMRNFVVNLRSKLIPTFTQEPTVDGIHKGAQPFVLWRNRFRRDHRQALNKAVLSSDADDPALLIPEDEPERSRHLAAFETFCRVFPDTFFVSERGRDYVSASSKQGGEKGRLLSAGFHSMMGYFRDDRPLYELILTPQQQTEIDRLWQQLDFVASAPMRQYVGFLWFERTDSRYMRDPEFDFARPENKASLTESFITRLSDVYLQKAQKSGAGDVEEQAILQFFREINDQIRWVESTRKQTEPQHLSAVHAFADSAWRRPLSLAERNQLTDFYQQLRDADLGHEESIRDTIVSVLMSPEFIYRVDLLATKTEPQPLTQFELASRLSYFLWASAPDQELLQSAHDNQLSERKTLLKHTRRMLQDDRVRGFATEFCGQWLDFRRFQEHNSVDRERFPQFTDELRQAMFEEPVRFIEDAIQHDLSILSLLDANHTFVNSTLAQHYGMPQPASPTNWVRIEPADQFQRGGLLPMSVFLTRNSPGLRTSPVKRGYWVVRRLLGERIPPPPPNVPELPADESQLGELTLRETLARHRDHAACAGCHDRFDTLGVAFEGFGPTGELRTMDLGNRPVVTSAIFPGDISGNGLTGLKTYLQQHRQDEFIDNLCRKLLSYGLSRTLILPDDLLVEKMKQQLKKNDHRFSAMMETIVTSPQFLNKRGR